MACGYSFFVSFFHLFRKSWCTSWTIEFFEIVRYHICAMSIFCCLQLDEEQSKIAAMSNAEIQADAEEYIWPHEEYKEDPSGCGYPLCVLDNQTPKRMRSFCQLMKWIKDDGSNEYRPFHFQKADCINASKTNIVPFKKFLDFQILDRDPLKHCKFSCTVRPVPYS